VKKLILIILIFTSFLTNAQIVNRFPNPSYFGIGQVVPSTFVQINGSFSIGDSLVPNDFFGVGITNLFGSNWAQVTSDGSSYLYGVYKDGNNRGALQTYIANTFDLVFDTAFHVGGLDIQGRQWQYNYGGYPTSGQILTCDNQGNASWQNASVSGWALTGNSGTNPAYNYVGTNDNTPFVAQSIVNGNHYANVTMVSPNGVGGGGSVSLNVTDSANQFRNSEIAAYTTGISIVHQSASTLPLTQSILFDDAGHITFDFSLDTNHVSTDSNYIFPTGNAVGTLTNDGEGNLSWKISTSSFQVNSTNTPDTIIGSYTLIACDAAVAPLSITLPLNYPDGQTLVLSDWTGNASGNNITIIAQTGQSIVGSQQLVGGVWTYNPFSTTSISIISSFGGYSLTYYSNSNIWLITSSH